MLILLKNDELRWIKTMLYKKPRQRITEEFNFLDKFLNSGYFDKFNGSKYNLTIIQEPFTQVGYADLVCIRWNKSIRKSWVPGRNKLIKNDIKILHHLFNCRFHKSIDEIVKELGFSDREVNETLFRLLDANLITENKIRKVKIRPLKDIFFIHEIIAIEAKLKDWKRALEQSLNNVSFASKSFSLFPDKTISHRLLKNYKENDVGVLSFGTTCREVVKPRKHKIPTAITSWYFNEYIGRNNCPIC